MKHDQKVIISGGTYHKDNKLTGTVKGSGTVQVADGSWVQVFMVELTRTITSADGLTEITHLPVGAENLTATEPITLPMTEETYKKAFGLDPFQDDLDRVNCPQADTLGHSYCGVCLEHHKPRFACGCLSPAPSLCHKV